MSLVHKLVEGPVDIVGDIHGELDALTDLLGHLGYSGGSHPDGRQLVFVGDLVDRGPDSVGVVKKVKKLVENKVAQCILGNHEINLLLDFNKHGSNWFLGKEEALDDSGKIIPQTLADEGTRKEFLSFFKTLPLALERDDLRIVHACWDKNMISIAKRSNDVISLYNDSRSEIIFDLDKRGITDEQTCTLERQNRNPVRILAHGPEKVAVVEFEAAGKWRTEERRLWWNRYTDKTFCVFGHYWRKLVGPHKKAGNPFVGVDPLDTLGDGNCMCIDYYVGERWRERLSPDFDGTFDARLGALRYPEKTLVFDNGEIKPIRNLTNSEDENA